MELFDSIRLEEYKKLQNEIQASMGQIADLEKYALTLSGGIFTWLLVEGKGLMPPVVFFIPAALVLLFGLIAYGHLQRSKLIGSYIIKVYESPVHQEPEKDMKFGWETFLHHNVNYTNSALAPGRAFMWLILLVADLCIAAYFYYPKPIIYTTSSSTSDYMHLFAQIIIALVALEHLYFLYFEMFAWETIGKRTFRSLPEHLFTPTKALAANQGLYNGFLAAGLIWSLLIADARWSDNVAMFFLGCVVVAGLYGAYSAGRKIFYVQALPAIVALLLLVGKNYF